MAERSMPGLVTSPSSPSSTSLIDGKNPPSLLLLAELSGSYFGGFPSITVVADTPPVH